MTQLAKLNKPNECKQKYYRQCCRVFYNDVATT